MPILNHSRRIPTLDGWRALAIVLVIVHHAGAGLERLSEKDYFAVSPTRFGVNGVPIFFALSGLLICKLLLEEYDAFGRISLSNFYTRRAFRILPPLMAFLLMVAGAGLFKSSLELFSCLGFFRNYLPANMGSIFTNHIWSLSVEEHFYIAWPGVLILLLRGRYALLLTGLAALGVGLWRSVDLHVNLIHRLAPALDTGFRTDYRLDGLLWGCTAAFLLHRAETRVVLEKYLRPVAVVAVVAFYCALQVMAVPLGAVWLSIAIVVALLGTVTHPDSILSKLLSLPAVRWLGRISYSLYLWQQVFLLPAWESSRLPFVQEWPWNIAATFLIATGSYYLIEKPMISVGRKVIAGVKFQTTSVLARVESA